MSDEIIKALTQHGPLAILCGAQLWVLVIVARALASAFTEVARSLADVREALSALTSEIRSQPTALQVWLLQHQKEK